MFCALEFKLFVSFYFGRGIVGGLWNFPKIYILSFSISLTALLSLYLSQNSRQLTRTRSSVVLLLSLQPRFLSRLKKRNKLKSYKKNGLESYKFVILILFLSLNVPFLRPIHNWFGEPGRDGVLQRSVHGFPREKRALAFLNDSSNFKISIDTSGRVCHLISFASTVEEEMRGSETSPPNNRTYQGFPSCGFIFSVYDATVCMS